MEMDGDESRRYGRPRSALLGLMLGALSLGAMPPILRGGWSGAGTRRRAPDTFRTAAGHRMQCHGVKKPRNRKGGR